MATGKQGKTASKNKRPAVSVESTDPSWVDLEAGEGHFVDARLERRFKTLVEQISECVGGSIPFACQDWAAAKAAYRFFSNPRLREADILSGHFEATRARMKAAREPILILHDSSEFTYQRESAAGMGLITQPRLSTGSGKGSKLRRLTVRGLLMHASLALTLEELPLGLCAVKFWTRKRFKGGDALKRKINPTRVPVEEKESFRWLENLRQSNRLLGEPARGVHIGDRESDRCELFCAAAEEKTHFLVRTCVDRLAIDGEQTIAKAMEEPDAKGMHRLELRTKDGKLSEARLEIRYRRLLVLPPIGKQKRCPSLELTVIHAKEKGQPEGREPIDWKLLTNLPIQSIKAATEKLGWYALRWKIEVFHKILKSGCQAEESLLRSTERIVKLIAVFCVVSGRVFWLTMLNRSDPQAPPDLVLTEEECLVRDRAVKAKPGADANQNMLSAYLTKVAQLGGYLARRKDPPPGNLVMWRGMRRLADLMLGAQIGIIFMGN
jgi:hypothetical protein